MPRAAAAPHALCFMCCSLFFRVGLIWVGLLERWPTGGTTTRRASSLHGPAEEAGRQAALDDGEEEQARDGGQQRAGGELGELHLTLLADEVGEREREGLLGRVLDEHEGEEELVPCRDEREQAGGDEARCEQGQQDAAQDPQ